MPHDPVPTSRLRLHSEPEVRLAENRSAEGQRLDAARADFRAAWQAKVDQKRRLAVRARHGAVFVIKASQIFILAGGFYGAAVGALRLSGVLGLPLSFDGVIVGFLLGFIAFSPSLYVGAALAAVCRRYAERSERQAQELERC